MAMESREIYSFFENNDRFDNSLTNNICNRNIKQKMGG